MSVATSCQQCGATLSGDGPGGSCPSCLMALAVEEDGDSQSGETAAGRMPARYFGDYELLEELARGGMGVVYRARQVSLNRPVALKMILAGQLATPAAVQRFHIEAESAARLEHSNIVPIYEIGVHEGQHYYSMKLIQGGTLADSPLKPDAGSRRSLEEAAGLMAKVARAVQFAHQRGILHRDLKPTNILLDEEGEPHVADFGLAKLADDNSGLTVSSAVMGTPAYMSPEQAEGGAKSLTTAADVYSLGAILYELSAGRPPFYADTAIATMRRVCEEQPASLRRLNPIVDRDLETICLKCLCKNPEGRYATAAMLADDLECWLRHEPIAARPSSALQRFWSWRRREPALAGSLVAIAALLLIVAIGSPVAAYRINRERLRAEDAQKKEAALRASAQVGAQIARALNFCYQGKFEDAKTLMRPIGVPVLTSERKDAASVYSALTDASARRGRWREALLDATNAVQCDATDNGIYFSLMPLLAAVEDEEAYQRYRPQVLARLKNADDVFLGEGLSKVALLRSGPLEELTFFHERAEAALNAATSGNTTYLPYDQFTMGLADYRLGQFANAIAWSKKSLQSEFYGAGRNRAVQAYMVLAMSLFRLDRHSEAQEALVKGIEVEQTELPKLDGGDLGPEWYWRDWVIAHELMREAKALIER
jgi:tRNA A-37 threonylcarbamoyl transferase component Bud32/tetratricopeptide (TPR) repeat protein